MSKAVILVALLAGWAALAAPSAPPASAPVTKPKPPAAAPQTSFPAVDTSRLDPVGKAFFEKVANEEVCPCDCPKSFGQCLQEGTKCRPAVLLAHWIIKNLEDGTTPEQLQEAVTRELTSGFGSTLKAPDLKSYATKQMETLFRDEELERALDDMYQRPLLETAADLLNRLMRSGVNDEELAEAVKSVREEGRLTYAEEDAALREPRVVCSMGLIAE